MNEREEKAIMKKLILLAALIWPLSTVAGGKPVLKQTYEATCDCGCTSKLKPIQIVNNSFRSVKQGEVNGNIVERTLIFKCPGCKEKFTQRAEDVFVPEKPKAKAVK